MAIESSPFASLICRTDNRMPVDAGTAVRIRLCVDGDAATLARLHSENIYDRLGIPLLEVYYRACLASQRSFCVCAEADGRIVGYVGVISVRAELLKTALQREFIAVLRLLVRQPAVLHKLISRAWHWFRFSITSQSQLCLPAWEYRPVLVAKAYRGRHIAQLLLASAGDILSSRDVQQVHLWVARDNVSAMRAYERSGFNCVGDGRLQTVPMLKNLGPLDPAQIACRQVASSPS